MCQQQPPPPHQNKVPKDGIGPRGFPDCYYTSRVLNSTFRYARFVKRLRAQEDEIRRGDLFAKQALLDQQTSDFFIRCTRRSLINDVARRVELCMESYMRDLADKRLRLKEQLNHEEKENLRKFVIQAQAGNEAIWQDKLARLEYLRQKRKKEHEDKYKETPIGKATHITPCLVKFRAMEAQDIQLYQMREKQAMKAAERELDRMWHVVAMREAEALGARMELDAIERARRDRECTLNSDLQMKLKKQNIEKEREMLKQETLRFKTIWEEDNLKEAEAERIRQEKRMNTAKERKEMIEERRQNLAKQEADQQLISKTWDSLATMGIQEEKDKAELRRTREKELDICNARMIRLKDGLRSNEAADNILLKAEAQRQQDIDDRRRCEYKKWSYKTNSEVRKAMIEQIQERKDAREILKKKMAEQDEYYRQVAEQTSRLVEHKERTAAEAGKRHQQDLAAQIQYNKLLKERAKQEELDQIKKYNLAAQEYKDEIEKMMQRPSFSEEIHPFMKEMIVKKVAMKPKCPCSRPDYCK